MKNAKSIYMWMHVHPCHKHMDAALHLYKKLSGGEHIWYTGGSCSRPETCRARIACAISFAFVNSDLHKLFCYFICRLSGLYIVWLRRESNFRTLL
jgi:hypothetical protein